MRRDSNVAPVIIKRKRKGAAGGRHHGGAWKVAYADFVTAMMAFFMLMWLLNATTEKQRKGLADYFSPTIALARVSGGGDNALGGNSVFAENTLPRTGMGATSRNPTEQDAASGDREADSDPEQRAEEERFQEVAERLNGQNDAASISGDLLQHITTRVTDEGLVIELHETKDGRLFDADGSATDLLRRLAGIVRESATLVLNRVALEGHTAAYPKAMARDPAWQVSNDRAHLFRNLLVRNGFDASRVLRVTSHANREPASAAPMDLRNTRLEIVFLRRF